MYRPSMSYIVITHVPTYLPTCETYFVQNWLPRWNQILTQLRFIHNWVITGIQWLVCWWVLVHCGPKTLASYWLLAEKLQKYFGWLLAVGWKNTKTQTCAHTHTNTHFWSKVERAHSSHKHSWSTMLSLPLPMGAAPSSWHSKLLLHFCTVIAQSSCCSKLQPLHPHTLYWGS
jgi:hypothetical protein